MEDLGSKPTKTPTKFRSSHPEGYLTGAFISAVVVEIEILGSVLWNGKKGPSRARM